MNDFYETLILQMCIECFILTTELFTRGHKYRMFLNLLF